MFKATKRHYDFSKGKRGAVSKVPPKQMRVTILLDKDILDWFRQQVDDAGGGNYQTLINQALRSSMSKKQDCLETTLRRVVRDELLKRDGSIVLRSVQRRYQLSELVSRITPKNRHPED